MRLDRDALLWVALVAAPCACVAHEDPHRDGALDARPDAEDGRGPGADVADAAEQGPGEAGPDGDGDGWGAPVTLVLAEIVVVTDRSCDLDGDGLEDNAVADLGSPSAELFATTLSQALQGNLETTSKTILHVPWIADAASLSDPEILVIIFTGEDEESPDDRSDDLSGDEAYYIETDDVDACGEPLGYTRDASIAGGELVADGASFPLGSGLTMREAELAGVIAAGGAEATLRLCGLIALGAIGGTPLHWAPGFTFLELLLAGGAPFGIPSLPGLLPNVDVDGDGLERIELDDSDHVASCIDGDSTVIDGPDCWMDPRMADGFALEARLGGVSARFLGREPNWELRVEGECPDGPPAESLFDPR